ncbi:MAG: HDOD domain-containing protein, partial [Deltaproteobacteria bacterium]|nr:HDOD domain-containing protein [Deltaproteobacteria bacterium]
MAKATDLLKKFNNIKTLPHVAIRLSRLISDSNSAIKEFEEVISMDPALVVRLLKVVNSSYYGLQQKVALKDIFKEKSNNGPFSRNQLWLHCAASSILSRMISERIFGQKGEDAFLCGLLHDIGMMVEDQVAQDLFLKACQAFDESDSKAFINHEREILGTDHAVIGYMVAKDWNLPEGVQSAIKLHHHVLDQVSPTTITGILQISEFMLSKLKYSALPGMQSTISPSLAHYIRDNIEEFKLLIRDFPGE